MGTRYLNCHRCGADIEPPQRQTVSSLCVFCGEESAREERSSWCVVPLHKSNYMKVNLKSDLRGINNKGGLVK